MQTFGRKSCNLNECHLTSEKGKQTDNSLSKATKLATWGRLEFKVTAIEKSGFISSVLQSSMMLFLFPSLFLKSIRYLRIFGLLCTRRWNSGFHKKRRIYCLLAFTISFSKRTVFHGLTLTNAKELGGWDKERSILTYSQFSSACSCYCYCYCCYSYFYSDCYLQSVMLRV